MPKNVYLPKENFPKIEEVKEIENKTPTYEEFLRTYQEDEKANESYENELNSYGDIGIVKGYGPCYKCGRGELTFELEIVLKNSRGGWKRKTVYDIVDALRMASKIERKEGFWSNDSTYYFSSRERESIVNRIINSVDEHVSDNRSIDRIVNNDIDDDDCLIL